MKVGVHLRALMRRAALALVVCMLLMLACSSDEKAAGELAQGCHINSDCSSPLVCAFQKCHTACAATRDCPAGLRCVVSDRPFYVCQLASEQTCTFNSNCPEGQVCAVDGECRDQCQAESDCLAQQKCVSGTCAESTELRDGGLPVVVKDASPSTGQPCSYNSECPDRLVCTRGFCQVECISALDCAGGRQCIQGRCQIPLCPELDAGTGVACSFGSDCAAPLVCRRGTCACECLVSGDCSTGYGCVGNRCAPLGHDTVGPEGGLLVSPDRRLTLEVPPGALTERVKLTMDIAEAWPHGALGPVFEVRPTGTTFAVPATFIYRYQPGDISPVAAPDIRLAVATGSAWNRLLTDVNVALGTATAKVSHLSTYGLVGPEGAVDAGVDGPGGDADTCATAVCSGTVKDGCCPAACTPMTDTDCAGCGNGRIEPGETCDPPGSCPVCDDQNDCTDDPQTGTAAMCNVVCQHTAKTCSVAAKDRCCPVGCTAQNDLDCAGCGDGTIDPTAGETCDPPGSCPTGCPAGQCCAVTTYTGSPATCNARCSTTQLPCSGATSDGCCPPGCNTSPANRDVDCAATCGNGIVDVGETCDPLTSCATTCPQVACTLRTLANGGTCQAQCQTSGTQTTCVNNDGCCPNGCNAVNDNNCTPVCGNGVLEAGELCEGASCPTQCPNQACTIRALQGALCQRQCVDAGSIAACMGGDNCCPVNCTAMNDADCAGCGNGRLEAGETCDPPGSCPSCDDQNDCTNDTQTGSAATCNLVCSHTAKTCSVAGKDRCCPTGCTAQNDSDCAGCGDGTVDVAAGETCDPPSSCPTGCTPGQCWDVKTFTGSPATCNARCSTTQLACSGATADGCCPPGCNTSAANRDVDCPTSCGNGIVETGETCDPLSSCPMTCPAIGCQLRSLSNGGTCQAACQNAGTQVACSNNDNCCPGGGFGTCNSTNDNNCAPVCGNGVIESGETCDGNCPAACPNQACTQRALQGAGCQRQCVDVGTITTCSRTSDTCCPAGGACNSITDVDCAPMCGNGVVEAGELCDGNCPTSCPNQGCMLQVLNGTGCQIQCVAGGTVTGCANNDNCCPNMCNAVNDNNCAAVCGNGVVEPGETCDGNCPTPANCISDVDTIRTFSGTGCNVVCASTPRPCVLPNTDGYCPSMCNSTNDADCPPTNDKCPNAIDLAGQPSWTVNIPGSAQQDAAAACGAKGPEIFYTFKLQASEFIYLSVLDSPISGNAVPATLELYAGCPPAGGGNAIACDAGAQGQSSCRRNPFPLITSSNTGALAGKPMGPGTFFVAVRATQSPGTWTLTFHHVPLQCVSQGEIVPTTQMSFIAGNTCGPNGGGNGDNSSPTTCGAVQNGFDDNYAVYKCPNQSWTFTTCDRSTTSDTMLSSVLGSLLYQADAHCVLTDGAKEVACNNDLGAGVCPNAPLGSEITNVGGNQDGIMTMSVDTAKVNACGAYRLETVYK